MSFSRLVCHFIFAMSKNGPFEDTWNHIYFVRKKQTKIPHPFFGHPYRFARDTDSAFTSPQNSAASQMKAAAQLAAAIPAGP